MSHQSQGNSSQIMSRRSRASSAKIVSKESEGSSFNGDARVQTLFFACKYGFKPEGVRVLTKLYEQGLGAFNLPPHMDYKLRYDTENDIFNLKAPHYVADDILKLLGKLTDRMVNVECDYPEEDEERVLNPNSTKLWVLDTESKKAAVPLDDDSFPVDIRYYPARMVWRSTIPNKEMGSVITEDVQERIARSTKAILVEDLNKQKIFVASNEESQTSLAVKKLGNVERFWNERVREDYNVFYAEKITDFEVCFLKLPAVKKKLPETTLLDPAMIQDIERDYWMLNNHITVRCCHRVSQNGTNLGRGFYNLKKGEKLRPVITEDEKQSPSLKWANFSYAKKGNWTDPQLFEPENGSILMRDNEQLNMVDVSHWTQGLPDAPEIMNAPTDHLLHRNHEDLSSYPVLSYPPRMTMGSLTPNENNRPGSLHHNSVSSLAFTSQYDTPAFSSPASRSDDPFTNLRTLFRSDSSFGMPASVTLPVSTNEVFPRVSPANVQGFRTSDQPGPDRLIELADREAPKEGRLANSRSGGSLDDLEGLVLSSMSDLMPAEDLDRVFGRHHPSAPNANQNRQGPLPHDSRFQEIENQIENHGKDEPSTRKFHQTMRQKAPATSKADFLKGAPPTIIPSHECLETVECGLRPILSQMRNYGGNLTLKAELGRIIIERKIVPHLIYNEDDYNSCDINQAEHYLSSAQIKFTNLVTTLPAEAQFILEMKDDQGQRIWRDQPKTWPKVRFFFSCRDKKSNTWFDVEMDGENHSFQVKSEPYTFGIVNIHAMTRNWDFRIVGEASESLGLMYKGWAEEFVQSISIPENRKKLEMTFEIADAHEVEILSLRVRRECDHPNLNGECTLHIDEVEDMCIRTSNAKAKTLYWIKAHDDETNPPKSFTRNWLEFSVTSNRADEAFKENLSLDIGEEANWRFDDLNEKGLIWNLCHPMSQIVAKADGIGFFNEEARPDHEAPANPIFKASARTM